MAQNAVVLSREIREDDSMIYEVQKIIKDVPDDVLVASLKRLLEGVGAFSHDDWKYAYKVVFEDDLDSVPYNGNLHDDVEMYIKEDQGVKYDDLLDELGEEKRITLRVSMGLHTMLVSSCKGKSLNTLCVEALSKAVGFEGVPAATAPKKD